MHIGTPLLGDPLGFSLNPFHYVAQGAKAAGKGVAAVGKGAYTAGKYTVKAGVAVAKNPLVQAGVSSLVPGGGAAVAAVNAVTGGGGGNAPAQVQAQPGGGTVDLGPAQDAAAAAPDSAPAKGGKGGEMITLPGVGPVKRSTVIIGGSIFGAVLLIALLKK